jgi:MFS family permease
MPTIIKQMGFSSSNAQLMTIPAYCVGALSAYTSARFSDRFGRRMPFIVSAQTIVVIAYSILAPLAPRIRDNIGPCYFAICLACLGLYPINPGGNAWTANNLAGPAKRAMGMAFMISMGNMGGLVGSYIFIGSEAPAYPTGYGCSIGFAGAGIVAATSLEFALIRINKKRAAIPIEEIRAKYTDEELEKMGDRSPLFKYTL